TGYFKVYGERFTKFWCCTGTGMENFTKLGDSLYFHSEDTVQKESTLK
ncbi:MAG: glycoside hydrolase family 127 protein, partial [Clostridia bacterium]|nr:glycoside hydrolase family 127 protein [Clostridia bacterium]